MRVFNELKGRKYEKLTGLYEKYLPSYFDKLSTAHKTYPEALENKEYELYVKYNKWPIRKLEYSFVISMIQEAVFSGAKVLDAGCGVSSMPFLWAELGGNVTAVDFDEKSIALMQKFDTDSFFGADRHISVKVCDIAELPFTDGSFDVVVSTSVLEHLPYPNYLLAFCELYRVLKEGGMLIVTCDVSAGSHSKRRAVGAFSVSDLKKILSVFGEELIEEEISLKELSMTEEEIERFWLEHYYDGIGYTGNRGYAAVGFRIKKTKNRDIRAALLKYEDLIGELICYETCVAEKEKELFKVNEYARLKTEENEKLQKDIARVEKEDMERLVALEKVTEESKERLEVIQIKEQEREKLQEEIDRLTEESRARLAALEKVTEESRARLEAINYLKNQIKSVEYKDGKQNIS